MILLASMKEVIEMRIVRFFRSLIAQFTTAFDVEFEVDEESLLEFNEKIESRRLC